MKITILNNGCADEFITNIALSWPQGTNGNLKKIKHGGDTLWTWSCNRQSDKLRDSATDSRREQAKDQEGDSEVLSSRS